MLNKKVKLKSLHIFMAIILLLGLLQPSLALAADSTNVEDGNEEVIVEGVSEDVEEAEMAAEAVEKSAETDDSAEEVEESTEVEENAEEAEEPAETDDSADVEAHTEAGNNATASSGLFEYGDTQVPEIEFDFQLNPDSISEWELARSGFKFSVNGPKNHEGTVSFAGQTEEFTVEYFFEETLLADLSPGTYPVTVTIGNTSKTQDLEVVSDDEFWEETTNPTLSTGRVHVLTKSAAEELGTLRVDGSDFYYPSSVDVLVNGNKVETIHTGASYPDTEIDISELSIGEHTVEFTHPTGSATATFNIISDDSGTPAAAGTFEGLTYQYQAGGIQSSNPFELPITFEIDENGILQNLHVEYWWVCILASPGNQSGFSYADEIPPTQIDHANNGEAIRLSIKDAMKEIASRTEKDQLMMRSIELY